LTDAVAVFIPSWYPIEGVEHVVPFESSRQYPRVPKVIVPSWPATLKSALRKKTDLKYGTQKETTARRAVATRVTMKPGVAGRTQIILPSGKGKCRIELRGEGREDGGKG
jgi:hypothetical protein